MIQVSRKHPEGGAMVAFVLLFFAAMPAFADEFPGGGCMFYKVGTPEYRRGDLQFMPGRARSFGRRFLAIPGIGAVTALNVACAIDDPTRFKRSRDVAAYFGLTSKRWQSGSSIDVKGRISKVGDGDVRRSLYEAATVMLKRFKGKDAIKDWGLKIAKRRCHAKAAVAVARKLATVMHAMWRDGTYYVGDNAMSEAEAASWMKEKLARVNYARS
jgi:transposase